MSRYLTEVISLLQSTKAQAVYVFVLEGDRGTGGCHALAGMHAGPEYRRRCLELIALLRRSADLLQADVDRQVPPGSGGGR